MQRTARVLLSLVMLALVTAPNGVQVTTASPGAEIVAAPIDAALYAVGATLRQPPLRPDRPPSYLVDATRPRGRCEAATAAHHRIIVVNAPLVRWRTHLPRSQADEPPPTIASPPRTIFA